MLVYPKVSPKISGIERIELQQNGDRINNLNNQPTTMLTLTNKTGEKHQETREREQSQSRFQRFIRWNINPMGPCPDGASKKITNGFDMIWRCLSMDAFFVTILSSTLPENLMKFDYCWALASTEWLSVSSVLLLTWRAKLSFLAFTWGTHGQWEHELIVKSNPKKTYPKSWHSCKENAGRTSNDWNTSS